MTALKTLTLRLRGASTELQEAGLDAEGMAETTSKLRAELLALTGGKVDIMLDNNTFKNTTQILREMSSVWGELTDVQAAAALELMGGKRQANILSALITNFDTVEDVIETSANSAGSALRENEVYLDSIQGKLDQFTNAMQTMWSSELDSDWVKDIVDAGTWIVKLVDGIGLLRIAMAGMIFFLNKKFNIWDKFFQPAETGIKEMREAFAKAKADLETSKNPIKRIVAKRDINRYGEKIRAYDTEAAERIAAQDKTALKTLSNYEGEVKRTEKQLASLNGELTATDKLIDQIKTGDISQVLDADAVLDTSHAFASFGVSANAAIKGRVIDFDDFATAATQIDGFNAALGKGQAELLNYIPTLGSADASLQAYLASLNGTQGSLQGFQAFITQHNAGVKASGVAAKAAAVGYQILNAAISMGISLLIQFAIEGLMKLFGWLKDLISPTEKLSEELSDLKSELSDTQSELNSINSGLKTTQDRMAELLAMDSLSFTEKEELEQLKKENAELERRKNLLEEQEKREKERVAQKAAETVDSQMEDKGVGWGWYVVSWAGAELVASLKKSTEDKLKDETENIKSLTTEKSQIEEELLDKNLSDKDRNKKEKKLKKIQKQLDESDTYVDETLAEMGEYLDGVEYGYGADEQLDTYYNALYAREIAAGTVGAAADGIEHILSRPEHEAVQEEIDILVEQFDSGEIDENTFITKITEQAQKASEDLEAMGLTSQDVADYFTMKSAEVNFATIDGKIAEMEIANERFKSALTNSADFAGLFDRDGNASEVAIAEYFQGTSEATRQEVARLIQQIKDEKLSIEDALKSFEYFGIESTLDIYISEVQTNFKDVFTDLDDADGLIDTFQELGEAIGSTSDALKAFKKAQAEMALSGRVSIETALQLMEYTDDYGSVLEVVDGKLQLADGAENALIQTRINAIKTSAEASLSDATNAYNKAVLARQSYESALTEDLSAEVVAKSWEKVLAAGAGLWEGIKSLVTEESWTDAYNRGYNETLSQITGYETEYSDAGMQALVDAENEAKELVDQASDRVNLVSELTPETLEDMYDSDDVDNLDDVKEKQEDEALDAFQKEMDYWERQISANQAKYEQVQNEIDLLEKQGKRAGEEYYKEQIALEEQRRSLLNSQLTAAKEFLAKQEEGSDNWWEAASIANDLQGELDSVTASIQDLSDAMAQIKWDNLEEVTNRFSDLHDELSDIRDILQADEMFDDEGGFTEVGTAVVGSYVQELEMYKDELAILNNEIADLLAHPYEGNEDYLKEAYSIDSEQEYNDLVIEWKSAQREMVASAEDTASAIMDVYSEQVDSIESAMQDQVDAYSDYLDMVKSTLDAERELWQFKKDIEKESKSMAETERKIAALSGSTNAADIAERRKLEQQLAEQKESINDKYESRAYDQRTQALDDESEAYANSVSRYIESLRKTLEEQSQGLITFTEDGAMVTNAFLDGVTATVIDNADIVLNAYETTGTHMSDALVQPWEAAAAKIAEFGGEGGSLEKMNQWTTDTGFFGQFKKDATGQLTSPWNSGGTAASTFKNNVTGAMNAIVSNVRSNVTNLTSELNKVKTAYDDIYTSAVRAANAPEPDDPDKDNTPAKTPLLKDPVASSTQVTATLRTNGQTFSSTKSGATKSEAEKFAREAVINQAYLYHRKKGTSELQLEKLYSRWNSLITIGYAYANGTLGTKQDGWAITDESWIGEEITLAAGKNGQLQYLKKGSAVMPSDISANLVEWGKLNPADMMSSNVIQPNIANIATNNNQTIQLNIDSLVKAETITDQTLPKLEAMMDKKITEMTKQMNYALKRVGGR